MLRVGVSLQAHAERLAHGTMRAIAADQVRRANLLALTGRVIDHRGEHAIIGFMERGQLMRPFDRAALAESIGFPSRKSQKKGAKSLPVGLLKAKSRIDN